MTTHTYAARVDWSGTTGGGYGSYARDHHAVGVPDVAPREGAPREGASPGRTASVDLSAAPAFHGDADRLNPEQLLVMAAASCQLLSFLSLAARRGVDVVGYVDHAQGEMPDDAPPVRIRHVRLAPVIHVAAGTDHDLVRALVHQAHDACYVAHSLVADVAVAPTVVDA